MKHLGALLLKLPGIFKGPLGWVIGLLLERLFELGKGQIEKIKEHLKDHKKSREERQVSDSLIARMKTAKTEQERKDAFEEFIRHTGK